MDSHGNMSGSSEEETAEGSENVSGTKKLISTTTSGSELEAGCCTDLLDNVMERTTNVTCPIQDDSTSGGDVDGASNWNKDEYENATNSSKNLEESRGNGRDLDQELKDLDMDYNMFDTSTASLEDNDEQGKANNDIKLDRKKTKSKLQDEGDKSSQQLTSVSEKDAERNNMSSQGQAEKKSHGENVPHKSATAITKKQARRQHGGVQQLSASSLASNASSSSQSESKWDKRAARPEIFDLKYTPTRPEEYEVATLASSLGVPKPSRFGMPGRTVARLSPLLFPRPGQMKAVLMRQGRAVPVYQSSISEANDHAIRTIKDVEDQELCQLNHIHLLTNAIIFSSNVASGKGKGSTSGGNNKGGPGAGQKQTAFNSRFLQGRNPRHVRRASDDSIEMEKAADAASAAAATDGDDSNEEEKEEMGESSPDLLENDRPHLQRQAFSERNAQQSLRNLVAGSQRFAGVLAEGTARMIAGPAGPRAERISALTAVVDLEYWPLSAVLCPTDTETNQTDGEEDEEDEDAASDDNKKLSDDSSTKKRATFFICLLFDNARFFVMQLHNHSEKEHWLTSIRSCAVAYNKQITAGKDTIDVEESARRMHQVMKTSLCSAAMHGLDDVVEKYLMTSKDTVRETDGLGNTAAYYAVQHGHNVCLAMLLDAGADPNALDHEERTLASTALGKNNLRALEMLEASGAKLTPQEKDGMQKLINDAVSAEKDEGDTAEEEIAFGGNTDAKGTMSDTMDQMNERGEKLQELDQKTANLATEAASFHDMAKQLKQKAKRDQERRIFGIF